MSYPISRDEAIAAVLGVSIEYQLIYGKKEPKEGFVRSLIKSIANIPQEETELKHGKWVKADSQQYFRKHYPCFTCSECGYRKDSQKKWNYCPNCGAKMEVE